MNLELEPEEYENSDAILGVILEAVGLLLEPEAGGGRLSAAAAGFPASRLRSGFGPEVVWVMNLLADRALELALEGGGGAAEPDQLQVSYVAGKEPAGECITVGQPFVGGSLTTRPLGSYRIDDRALLFEQAEWAAAEPAEEQDGAPAESISGENRYDNSQIDAESWLEQVERSAALLRGPSGGKLGRAELRAHLEFVRESLAGLERFAARWKAPLAALGTRIDRQLQMMDGLEERTRAELRAELEAYLAARRQLLSLAAQKERLQDEVEAHIDRFESCEDSLRQLNGQISARKRELKDGSKVRRLELRKASLEAESRQMELKIGLLLGAYLKEHSRVVLDVSSQPPAPNE